MSNLETKLCSPQTANYWSPDGCQSEPSSSKLSISFIPPLSLFLYIQLLWEPSIIFMMTQPLHFHAPDSLSNETHIHTHAQMHFAQLADIC